MAGQVTAPAVSILLPFRNEIEILLESIASVRSSTLANWELLLLADRAAPESLAIARQAVEQDSRIRVHSAPARGIVAALNRGLEMAAADIVARMDADDLMHPGRLEKQFYELRNNPGLSLTSSRVSPLCEGPLGGGTARYFDWINNVLTPKAITRNLFIESPLPHPSVMFRKPDILKLGGYRRYDGPEDYDLWLRMKEAGMVFSKLPDSLLQWRIHKTSLSKVSPRYTFRAFEKRKREHVLWAMNKGLAGTRSVYIWGAGRRGGRLGKWLMEQGLTVKGYIDIDPRKFKNPRHGLPVLSPNAIPHGNDGRFYLAYVAAWDARETIRAHLLAKGKRELEGFVIL